jgi:hypothetical protein
VGITQQGKRFNLSSCGHESANAFHAFAPIKLHSVSFPFPFSFSFSFSSCEWIFLTSEKIKQYVKNQNKYISTYSLSSNSIYSIQNSFLKFSKQNSDLIIRFRTRLFLYFKSVFEKKLIFFYFFLCFELFFFCVFRWFRYIDVKNNFFKIYIYISK